MSLPGLHPCAVPTKVPTRRFFRGGDWGIGKDRWGRFSVFQAHIHGFVKGGKRTSRGGRYGGMGGGEGSGAWKDQMHTLFI